MTGIVARVLRVVLILALLPVLGARAEPAGPETLWTHLDAARIGLVGLDGTAVDPVRPTSTGDLVTLRATGGPAGVVLRIPTRPGEPFFGLGERFGVLDLRGQVLHSSTADTMGRPGSSTTYAPMPFLISGRGYGLSLDTTADATFDLSAADAVTVRVALPAVTFQVLTGPGPADVIARHAQLIGLPPVPPAWGLGVWKSLVGGTDRVLADVDALQRAGTPLDAVWIYDVMDADSGIGWSWPIYGPVPSGRYPDPAALTTRLHARGLKVLGYLHPFLVPGRAGYAEAAARGYLVRAADGSVFTEPWTGGDRRAYVDFTSPAATRWWQDRVRHALAPVDRGGLGFDGAMQDYGEDAPLDGRYADGRPGTLVHNDYPVLYARAAREAAQSVRPDDTVLFARSGYAGAQAYVTGRFTGDQTRDWDPRTGLGSVLSGILNGGVSGWPYWGPDIGGFFDGSGARDRELWTRWVQLGALSPVMRDMLGAQADPIGVHTDAATLATFRGYARLHAALRPYLAASAAVAGRTGLPLARPLWLAAPADPVAWTVQDQYLLGPDLLVAPVVRPGLVTRAVYLPGGRWRDYWTGTTLTGPGWTVAAAPTERIPLFVRDGSALALPDPGALGLAPPV